MGGNAFSDASLNFPRMPPKVYRTVLSEVEETLSKLFSSVAHAIEAPEKKSHGDLDVLVVALPGPSIPTVARLAECLGAMKWFSAQKDVTLRFALPWPNESHDSSSPGTTLKLPAGQSQPSPNMTIASSNPTRDCIQLDLTICSTQEDLRWKLFEAAHADFSRIISTIIRSKGLTISVKSFYLRIASVEKHNRNAGRIELSRDPDQVLKYLGLNPVRFWRPFQTLAEMMKFIAECRFFDPTELLVDENPEQHDSYDRQMAPSDQARLQTRPIFRYWFDTFLPLHKNDTPGKDAHLTREQVLEDVYAFFGDHVRSAYETQKTQAEADIARTNLFPSIASTIRKTRPEISEADLAETIKALKRVLQRNIRDPSGKYTAIRNAFQAADYKAVQSWALNEHANVLRAQRNGELELQIPPSVVQRPASEPIDRSRISIRSKHELETYTEQDDEVIIRMKSVEQKTWLEIMAVLGKKSKSQLQAHWKMDLEGRVVRADEAAIAEADEKDDSGALD